MALRSSRSWMTIRAATRICCCASAAANPVNSQPGVLLPLPNSLVVEFAEIDADALARVGGKAVNLGALTRAGLPVPPGICVTTDAYHQVAASAGPTLEHVFDALASTSSTDTARLARLAAQARAALPAAPLAGTR